ncbi:MAG: LAGLIDADG family homing endonuclease [Candidatus Aenigmarchaeota archaeon]|nr:LAGLIDADG family homing endonuclease [Candidatus Aenigmarchaeota archaeon]
MTEETKMAYVEWCIHDFPEELLVKLKDGYLREVANSIGGQRKTARLLGVCFPYFHNLVHGKKSFSLRRLFQIIELSPQKEKFLKILEENIIKMKSGGRGYWFRVKFPFRLTPRLVRIIGHLLGDGNIRRTRGVNVRYGNSDHLLVKSFIKDMISIFGPTKYSIWRGNRGGCKDFMEVSFSSGIGRILRKFFGQCGTYDGRVPKVIMNADLRVKGEFLSGIFDDECTVAKDCIVIALTNKELIHQIADTLAEFNIECKYGIRVDKRPNRKIQHTLTIRGKENLEKFYKNIKLNHKNKKRKLVKWKKK